MSDFDSARLDRIGSCLDEDVASGIIPGAVVLVESREEIVYERVSGYRDKPAGAKMAIDTIFRGASMTKPLVSVAIMMLVEEGKLQIWDPVSTYLPEFGSVKVGVERTDESGKRVLDLVPCAKPMTVQDLLRHTSGLTYAPFGATQVHAQYRAAGVGNLAETNETLVTKLAALPLVHQPGTTFEYSMSTDVLGRMVEVVSGKTLDVFLDERIFTPLGMKDTTFSLPAEKTRSIRATVAYGHGHESTQRRVRSGRSAARLSRRRRRYSHDRTRLSQVRARVARRRNRWRRSATLAQNRATDDERSSAAGLHVRSVYAFARHYRAVAGIRSGLRPRLCGAHARRSQSECGFRR